MDLDDVSQPVAWRSTALGSRSVNPGRRIWRAAVAATVLAVCLIGVPGAALAQTTTDQRFDVTSAGPPGARRIVVAYDVVRGVGTEVITSNPDNAGTLVWTFPEGALFVTATYTLENVLDPRDGHPDPHPHRDVGEHRRDRGVLGGNRWRRVLRH